MRRLVFILAVGFCLCPVSDLGAATLLINAPKIELALSPGESYSGEIQTENPTDTEAKVKIYLEDWYYAPEGNGEKKFAPSGSTSLSASPWIHFSPVESTIKPFGRLTTRYTIQIPPDAKGGHYAVLFFETSMASLVTEEGVNIPVAGRIGALFFIEAKTDVNRNGEIKSVSFKSPGGNKPIEIWTTFHNSGDVEVTLSGKFLIMTAENQAVSRGELTKIYTFPGGTGSSKTEVIGRFPRGSYQVILTYDLGKGKSRVEEKTLVVE